RTRAVHASRTTLFATTLSRWCGHAEVIGKLRAIWPASERSGIERQHGLVPNVILREHSHIDVLAAFLVIGAFHRLVSDIEQERVVADLKILPIAVAHRLLLVVLVAPEQFACDRRRALRQRCGEVHAVERMGGIGGGTGGSKE